MSGNAARLEWFTVNQRCADCIGAAVFLGLSLLVCKYVIEGKEEQRKQKTLKHHFTSVFETVQGRRNTLGLGSHKHPSLQRDL